MDEAVRFLFTGGKTFWILSQEKPNCPTFLSAGYVEISIPARRTNSDQDRTSSKAQWNTHQCFSSIFEALYYL